MIYRARSYAKYLPKHRAPSADDKHGVNRRARCQCRNGERICPRHAPNLYTMGSALHRREGVAT